MSLNITSMMPDRSLEESEMIRAITKVAIDLAKMRDAPVQKRHPALDIVFLLPSRQESPGFLGLRLHSFDTSGQTLRIESAVPEKMVSSVHAERFVLAILGDAIDAAAEFFAEQNIIFDPVEHAAIVEVLTPKQQYAIN